MIIILSPAKSLDFEPLNRTLKTTTPAFIQEASVVNEELRKLSSDKLADLMGISPKLAMLNFERNQIWTPDTNPQKSKPAMLAFSGDVYQGLQAENFSDEQMAIAQQRIRILSGLYGILRPLDLIQAYRLEMGTDLSIKQKKDLYAYWTDRVTQALNDELLQSGNTLINLASNEYSKVVNTQKLSARIINPSFKDYKNGQYKIISFFAKRARGLMSRFVIENNITNPEEMKAFDLEGYYFNPKLSKENDWIFTRER